MSKVGFLWVGKLKERFSQDGCAHYWKKLSRFFQLEETLIKDAPGKLPPADKSKVEGERILAKVKPGDVLIILDEFGERMTSKTLADRLQAWTDAPNQRPVFRHRRPLRTVRRGQKRGPPLHPAERHDPAHELARLLLLEQLYRAGTIHKNMPYHHE